MESLSSSPSQDGGQPSLSVGLELEAAQLPLVLQLTKGPIQGTLPLPHHLLQLIREVLDHLGHRK